ncbi:hypothetical protein SDC9_96292 [bioreactor metagenome]|uniref:Single-stranded DNA-binding protein n=1 Tax=bioreactor metagenome TaxID=1076179 RepID=A0A645A8V7_9ZZZZ
MLKMIVTDAGVSKGFDGAPALRFYDGEGGGQSVRFRIGKKVFDSRAEGNHRWVNIGVKAFGDSCERIKKMKLKEGSFINIIGRYDEETWEDQNTHEKKSAPVLIVDEIEYCSGGGQKNGKDATGAAASEPGAAPPTQEQPAAPAAPPDSTMPGNFTGFDGFGGGGNPFF